MNGSMGEWFRTTVGVRQCYLQNLSRTEVVGYSGRNDGKVSIYSSNITNLRFVNEADALAEERKTPEALVESLDNTCTRFKMEISAKKTKLMANSTSGVKREV